MSAALNPLDEETARRLGWFITNRQEIAKANRCMRMVLDVTFNRVLKYGDVGQLISADPIIRDNEPCVCGSGRKWRKCCSQLHENE